MADRERRFLLVPLATGPNAGRGWYLAGVGRLKPGVSLEQAQAEINAITVRLEQQYPDSNTNYGARLVLLPEQIVGDMRPTPFFLTLTGP